MTLLNSPVREDELPKTKANEDEIRLLWDGILDILLERVHHKSISIKELAHIIDELNFILRAVKGRNGVWGSVIDVVLFLLRKDVSIHDLRLELPYNDSTIYRALSRLEQTGVAVSIISNDNGRLWTINKENCPVLYRATRPA